MPTISDASLHLVITAMRIRDSATTYSAVDRHVADALTLAQHPTVERVARRRDESAAVTRLRTALEGRTIPRADDNRTCGDFNQTDVVFSKRRGKLNFVGESIDLKTRNKTSKSCVCRRSCTSFLSSTAPCLVSRHTLFLSLSDGCGETGLRHTTV